MDILHLTYFLEVAVHKSFTKASQVLHVSQPSISKGIKTLETEWSEKLFVRHGRSVELTPVGEFLLPQIKNILQQFKQLEFQISEIKGMPYGNLAIGIPPMVGSSFLSPLINSFFAAYPHIDLLLMEEGSNQIMSLLSSGKAQVGFLALPTNNITDDYETYIFNHEPLEVVLYKNHPLKTAKEFSLVDIKDENLVFFNEEFSLYQMVMASFQKIGAFPNIVCTSGNWDFIAEMVKSRLGIGLLPKRICDRLNQDDFTIIPLTNPVIPWTLAMVWQKQEIMSTPTRLWVEFFKKEIEEVKINKV